MILAITVVVFSQNVVLEYNISGGSKKMYKVLKEYISLERSLFTMSFYI